MLITDYHVKFITRASKVFFSIWAFTFVFYLSLGDMSPIDIIDYVMYNIGACIVPMFLIKQYQAIVKRRKISPSNIVYVIAHKVSVIMPIALISFLLYALFYTISAKAMQGGARGVWAISQAGFIFSILNFRYWRPWRNGEFELSWLRRCSHLQK